MEIKDIIRQKRLSLGLTLLDVAKSVGVSEATVSRWESGDIENMRRDKIAALAKALQISPAVIMGWTDDEEDIFAYDNIIPLPKTKRLPLLGNVSCGEPVYADEQHDLFIESGAVSDADFCLKASGDSMIGANIFDGDIVFVRNQDVVNNGDIAVVLIGDEATLKRVHYDSESKELALFAENPAYKTMRFRGAELEQIRILGKAIAFQRYI